LKEQEIDEYKKVTGAMGGSGAIKYRGMTADSAGIIIDTSAGREEIVSF